MILRTLVISIVLIFTSTKTKAQNYELGKVTIEQLQEKVNPKDTTAPAAILFKKAKTFFTYDIKAGFTVSHVYEYKIKIYKKEGLSWADQKVRFYIGYENIKEDYLEFSNAITYNLENGKIVKTKLDGQGTFKNNVNKYWKDKAITLPNVKVGAVIEFKYVLKSENLVKFPDFKCQYEIPVNYFEYKTEIPEFYIYKPILIGGLPLELDSKLVNGSQSYDNEHHQMETFRYQQINAFYSGKDIPALTNEPYVNNVENYKGSIKHELERVRMPEKPVKDYSLTWEGVATTIFKEEDFGKELNERNFLLEDLKSLLNNVEDKDEKINIIFKFVQNKMNWNEENGYYTDKGVIKAYKDQTGNVAEINFILIDMLRFAGINANPVLVSTIENGVPVYPTRTGFNYVIAAIEKDGKQILLDASHKFTSPDILPLNVLNWKGRLIKTDGISEEINLEPTTPSKEISNLVVKLDSQGKIEGKVRIQKTNYDAYRFRIENANKNQEDYLEKLEQSFGNLKISNYIVENKKTNLANPVIETFAFETENQSEIIGDKIFINPMLFFARTKNPFNQDKRQMPVYFGYPTQEKFNLNLEIPEGYTVESLPTPVKIASEDKKIVYFFNISYEDNKVQIISLTEINESLFSSDKYNGLKEIFQKMITSQNQKIVLKKI